MYLCVCLHVRLYNAREGQRHSQKLELQAIVTNLTWVLEPDSESSVSSYL